MYLYILKCVYIKDTNIHRYMNRERDGYRCRFRYKYMYMSYVSSISAFLFLCLHSYICI